MAKLFALLKSQYFFLFEFLMIFRMMASIIPSLSASLLLQDKICAVTHHQSRDFCQNIQKTMNTSVQQAVKDEILAETTRFGNYK